MLTGLTRLAFQVLSDQGGVGASLAPLRRLADLQLALHHRVEGMLVMHPTVDWGALGTLTSLTRLEVRHLAIPKAFPFPEVRAGSGWQGHRGLPARRPPVSPLPCHT